jgi:pyruvate dehydrogenase E2 component (dihydrolipoamide acetyltransferase)
LKSIQKLIIQFLLSNNLKFLTSLSFFEESQIAKKIVQKLLNFIGVYNMKVEVVMPKMGESLQEGTIIQWLKGVGDVVERDEMILEISTDKVDTEVPSPVAGTIVNILAQENDVVEVGALIAEIETDADAKVEAPQAAPAQEVVPPPAPAPEPTPEPTPAPAQSGDAVDVVMPKMGESLQEGTIIGWLKQVGDKVERDEMILEISTDKVDTEVPSPVAGTLVEILAQENEVVEVGAIIARISTSGTAPVASTPAAKPAPKAAPAPEPTPEVVTQTPSAEPIEIPRKSGDRFYSPLVRTIAKENKVSLAELDAIKGTGLEGRVSKNDLLSYIDNRKATPASTQVAVKQPSAVQVKPESKPAAAPPKAVFAPGEDTEIIPMDRVRQMISDHMIMSKQTSAHVTSVAEADVTEIFKFRNANKDAFQQREGYKLTFTPFFAKAVIDAVKAFPMVNVSVDGTNIVRHRRINLGFATALPDNNLIVPVIKDSDALSISGLARSINDLASRARSKKLLPDDIQGGTVTLTNVGTFGTLFGTPIINQPQAAIFGVGAIKKRPVVKEFNGEDVVVVRQMMYVSITYDHRVIDGMLAGQTLATAVKSLESMTADTIQL